MGMVIEIRGADGEHVYLELTRQPTLNELRLLAVAQQALDALPLAGKALVHVRARPVSLHPAVQPPRPPRAPMPLRGSSGSRSNPAPPRLRA